MKRIILFGLMLLLSIPRLVSAADAPPAAAPPATPAPAAAPAPASALALAVYPPDVQLNTSRDRQRYIVVATRPDGVTMDVTAAAKATLANTAIVALAVVVLRMNFFLLIAIGRVAHEHFFTHCDRTSGRLRSRFCGFSFSR